ncbi:DUF1905 domain-containing protein [Spelaeicoccus albus]|uniref:Uncharacterized protein n=1 Tax=Spelaeicoccus albus TaxID=1280376 RepID=A0A7Z0AD67_9MICO|nr:DUF1905 domain-containing protein [Spelaeicoccus albus]NYI67281.1 hypothetical protein [Spelaeicoccus albus]
MTGTRGDAGRMTLAFTGPLWFWRGPAPFYFVTVPDAESAELHDISALVCRSKPQCAGRRHWTKATSPT